MKYVTMETLMLGSDMDIYNEINPRPYFIGSHVLRYMLAICERAFI